jgi:hypothetical protein
VNRFLNVVVSLIDVLQGSMLQTLREGIVLFLGHIAVSLLEQLGSAVETTGPIQMAVNRRVIVQILAIVDGGLLDFTDRGIDFPNCDGFFFSELTSIGTLQVGAGVTQIGQRVKIRRVITGWHWFCGAAYENQEQQRDDR